jgi:hypothetical protein
LSSGRWQQRFLIDGADAIIVNKPNAISSIYFFQDIFNAVRYVAWRSGDGILNDFNHHSTPYSSLQAKSISCLVDTKAFIASNPGSSRSKESNSFGGYTQELLFRERRGKILWPGIRKLNCEKVEIWIGYASLSLKLSSISPRVFKDKIHYALCSVVEEK